MWGVLDVVGVASEVVGLMISFFPSGLVLPKEEEW
jgi:hypothetical protein